MLKPIIQCSQAGVFASRNAPRPLPLSSAATVFLTSSRHNGVASKGHVFPANQHSIFRVKLPPRPPHSTAKSELLHEGARVNSKPELHLWARVQVLVRCEKQAVSQVLELRNHCYSRQADHHICRLAPHRTLWPGVSQCQGTKWAAVS